MSCAYGRQNFDFFTNIIGIYQGCPLSPTPYVSCIDELEQMVHEFVKQEGIEEVTIGNFMFIANTFRVYLKVFVAQKVVLKSQIKGYACEDPK